jgi:hypothetical protein
MDHRGRPFARRGRRVAGHFPRAIIHARSPWHANPRATEARPRTKVCPSVSTTPHPGRSVARAPAWVQRDLPSERCPTMSRIDVAPRGGGAPVDLDRDQR